MARHCVQHPRLCCTYCCRAQERLLLEELHSLGLVDLTTFQSPGTSVVFGRKKNVPLLHGYACMHVKRCNR